MAAKLMTRQRGIEIAADAEFPGDVHDLRAAIEAFLAAKIQNTFVWTAAVESITEKLSRCRPTLEKTRPGSSEPRSRKRNKKKRK